MPNFLGKVGIRNSCVKFRAFSRQNGSFIYPSKEALRKEKYFGAWIFLQFCCCYGNPNTEAKNASKSTFWQLWVINILISLKIEIYDLKDVCYYFTGMFNNLQIIIRYGGSYVSIIICFVS